MSTRRWFQFCLGAFIRTLGEGFDLKEVLTLPKSQPPRYAVAAEVDDDHDATCTRCHRYAATWQQLKPNGKYCATVIPTLQACLDYL